MAVSAPRMVETLDRYGFTGVPEHGPYPGGTNGWEPYPVPWGDILTRKEREWSNFPSDLESLVDFSGQIPNWVTVGHAIQEEARKQLPPPKDVDAMAWYLPFHYYGLDWGIYIKEASIIEVARLIYQKMGTPPLTGRMIQDLCRMGLTVLYLHEAFHHKVESFATRLELSRLKPVYLPYWDRVNARVAGTDDHLEEAVACGEMITRLKERAYAEGVEAKTIQATKGFLEEWIPTLKPGYRLGLLNRGEESKWKLQSQVAHASTIPPQSHTDWGIADNMLKGMFDKDAVAHVIVPVGTTPKIPWFSDLLSLPTDRVEGFICKQFGYQLVPGRGKGSHRWFECKSPRRPPITLPANRDSLSPKVLRDVAEALGYQSIRRLAEDLSSRR